AHRMIATQKRHSNSCEPVVIREAIVVAMMIAKHLVNPDHPGQPARYGHSKDYLLANRDSTVLGCARVRARRANLVAPLGLPQKDVNERARYERENKCKVDRDALRQAWNKFSQMRYVRAFSNRRGFHNRVAGNFVVILREVATERYGYEVQHYSVDDFVRAEASFQ